MFKKIIKSAAAAQFASLLITAYIRLVYHTTRWTFIDREHFDAAAAEGKGVILAFWHNRLLMVPTLRNQTEKDVYMLISTHRDGKIIARAVQSFGVRSIRGSAANPKKPGKNKSGAPSDCTDDRGFEARRYSRSNTRRPSRAGRDSQSRDRAPCPDDRRPHYSRSLCNISSAPPCKLGPVFPCLTVFQRHLCGRAADPHRTREKRASH